MLFRRRAAILMALILALYGMLHAWCLPAMALPGGLVAVCTAHGVQWVPADGPDTPAKPRHDCPACQAGHCGAGVAPPPATDLPVPTLASVIAGLPHSREAAPALPLQSPPARGPPPVG